jgi:ankyrin repeat protein
MRNLGRCRHIYTKGWDVFSTRANHTFKVWLTLCNIDTQPNERATLYWFARRRKSLGAPLYYAALCGFHDLVEHLITKHPQDVNADGGYYVRPLVAALARGHFRTADLLRHNGADLHVRGYYGKNPLHAAAQSGSLEVVRILVKFDPADINARDEAGWTPLFGASGGCHLKDGSVVRFLLEHGADIHARSRGGWTPLHWASFRGAQEVVRMLLKHGADVEAKDGLGDTALQKAAENGYDEVVKLLQDHGAK